MSERAREDPLHTRRPFPFPAPALDQQATGCHSLPVFYNRARARTHTPALCGAAIETRSEAFCVVNSKMSSYRQKRRIFLLRVLLFYLICIFMWHRSSHLHTNHTGCVKTQLSTLDWPKKSHTVCLQNEDNYKNRPGLLTYFQHKK